MTESHSWFSQPAHSLFLLGHREEVYDIDYQCSPVCGFVESQMSELRDPKAMADVGLETGIEFVPFGSSTTEDQLVRRRIRI